MTDTKKQKSAISAALAHPASPGILLIAAAALAMALDNSSLAWLYDGLLETPATVRIGALEIDKPILLWINDGLMAVFFFHVALEIKRELIRGNLANPRDAALPAIAAAGGMVVPALIFVAINWQHPEELRGWAIPAATDIAFALGVLALLGNAVPAAIKVFLLSLAIIDDLGAIVIIAAFYSGDLAIESLIAALVGATGLLLLNRTGVTRIAPYVLIGIFVWVCVLKSGVHATLAGVVLGFAIPLKVKMPEGQIPPLLKLEHDLVPWVAFFIMPVFAFANAGVPLGGVKFDDLLAPLPLGIALGLVIGKQLGVFGFAWMAVKSGLCRLPTGTHFMHLYGVSLLAGIGFTMSLFIGTLAFDDPEHARAVRLGVLSGSTIAGVSGYLVLRWATRRIGVTGKTSPVAS